MVNLMKLDEDVLMNQPEGLMHKEKRTWCVIWRGVFTDYDRLECHVYIEH